MHLPIQPLELGLLAPPILGHLFHSVTGEHSRIRRHFLRLYVIYELKFIKLVLWGINTRLGRTRLGERLIWWGFGTWLKRWAETGRPMSPSEVKELFDALPPESEVSIGNCRCKIARGGPCNRFREGTCPHPVETEITVRLGTPFYREGYPGEYRTITREQARERIEALRLQRHAPHVYYFCVAGGLTGKEFAICNCCKGACVPIEVNRRRMPVLTRGTRRASINPATCSRCFTCRDACLYEAISEAGGRPLVGDCYGCGICSHSCPTGSISMIPGPVRP